MCVWVGVWVCGCVGVCFFLCVLMTRSCQVLCFQKEITSSQSNATFHRRFNEIYHLGWTLPGMKESCCIQFLPWVFAFNIFQTIILYIKTTSQSQPKKVALMCIIGCGRLALSPGCNHGRGATWRIIQVSKWLITMVRKSPFPFQTADIHGL